MPVHDVSLLMGDYLRLFARKRRRLVVDRLAAADRQDGDIIDPEGNIVANRPILDASVLEGLSSPASSYDPPAMMETPRPGVFPYFSQMLFMTKILTQNQDTPRPTRANFLRAFRAYRGLKSYHFEWLNQKELNTQE